MPTERNKRWFPVVIACVLLIGTAVWASALIPFEKQKTVEITTTTVSEYPQLLCVKDGALVRVAADGETVLERYEVPPKSLPAEEQEALAAGIWVSDEVELSAILENYTG